MLKYKPVIGVSNQKGGVGKTTIARIVSEYLAINGKRVLAIDMDSQYSLSKRFLGDYIDPGTGKRRPPLHDSYDPNVSNVLDPKFPDKIWDGRSSIADIFFGDTVKPYKTKIPNLMLAPSDEEKMEMAENVKRKEIADKIHCQLHKFITEPEIQNRFDVFVVDTPPSKISPLTIAAFKAMTHLIIPLELEMQAIEGLQGILTLWKQEHIQRPSDYPINLTGIIPMKVHNRRSIDMKLKEQLQEQIGEHLMPFSILDRKQFPESDLSNTSIFSLPKSDMAKVESLKLCKYIVSKVF